jgi:hypothetical protein
MKTTKKLTINNLNLIIGNRKQHLGLFLLFLQRHKAHKDSECFYKNFFVNFVSLGINLCTKSNRAQYHTKSF